MAENSLNLQTISRDLYPCCPYFRDKETQRLRNAQAHTRDLNPSRLAHSQPTLICDEEFGA